MSVVRGRTVIIKAVATPDRLSGLDDSLLAAEDDSTHQHVIVCLLFEGDAPGLRAFIGRLEPLLERVPRHRRKLARARYPRARPVWVDDPRFNLGYHVREAALPPPAGARELQALLARIAGQPLDRSKPLWELWLVDRVGEGRFAAILKRHLSLVDPSPERDLVSVLLTDRAPAEAAGAAAPWLAQPEPSAATLLVEEVAGRLAAPVALARAVSAGVIRPERSLAELRRVAAASGALVRAALTTRPPSPLNAPIGPHRRFASVEVDRARLEAIAGALGGTARDVALSVVGGALRAHYARRRWPTEDVELVASAPVAGASHPVGPPPPVPLVPLPLDSPDPLERWAVVRAAATRPADGSGPVTEQAPLFGLQAAARQGAVRPFGNLPVVHVSGPRGPLALLGRPLVAIHPQIPLQRDGALSVAIMACADTVSFGLLGDYDLLRDLDALAGDLADAVEELAAMAGVDGDADGRTANGRLPSAAERRRRAARAARRGH